ncbi:helix-turn-helix domain-containing protein [Phenylobacterium aquaticum]|uniref:helix-turn-helix domain-containing protein n=1 Tax=Phenylobacterium aquaticum TaxID=1763816 RepID=UPI001F5DE529|nr:helix-turn-helix transcriptional regulator [Phenylobacterium aquaticum]MCI3135342.1 helix-turn-helix transcriptional regulator [Phenylobacterium aquaticum]
MPPKFSIAQPRLHETHGLSYRQLECLAWVHEGKSANDIGLILGISGRTVEKHLRRACENLGVRARVQAVVRARDLGVLVIPAARDLIDAPRRSWDASRERSEPAERTPAGEAPPSRA